MARLRIPIRQPLDPGQPKPRGQPRTYPPAMVGDRFGEWTVIAYWLPDLNGIRRVSVKCSCGVWRVIRENQILRGQSRSCGHLTVAERRERRRRLKEAYKKVEELKINIFREESAWQQASQ